MAFSYHVILAFFLLFSFVDVVLLSVRTLVSHRYNSLYLCYALMVVQESMLLFELLAVWSQLLSTYLLTTGMWGQVASLLNSFAPLWLLRAAFTASAVVYKNTLLPRQASAAVSGGTWDYPFHFPRAWGARGYGAVVSLDIACCCFYYLSSVYVLGYLSDETLYVPYHRRRWRHLRQKRAIAVAAAAGNDSQQATQRKRQRWEQQQGGGAPSTAGDGGAWGVAGDPAVMSLTRTPSFLQWKAMLHRRQENTDDRGTTTTRNGFALPPPYVEEHSGRETSLSDAEEARTNPNASTRCHSAADGTSCEEFDNNSANATKRVLNTTSADTKPRRLAEQHHHTASPTRGRSAGTTRQPQTASTFTSLPPLQLHRRFTSEGEEVDKQLHHFAKALIAHGYSPIVSTTDQPAPALLAGSAAPDVADTPSDHEG
ncbi:hypothetical protein JKF63_04438 [Porcisia hertigi]|uniref:Uncharacterized protein n=1 Tax=Porcisia hertigi TaxID=2761500 RepID=A0A836I5G8_9TRYP|nr:hypothetical protein JKF63_04438 [Porcisia hertigi]